MRILLLGSCVTRDAFEYQDKPWEIELVDYFARSCLASAMDPRPFEGVELAAIESPFQRRIVEYDLTKEFPGRLVKDDYDLVVYDLIDERFDLVENSTGAIATRSSEFVRSGYDYSGDRLIRSGTPEAFARWEGGWQRLVEALRTVGRLQDLRINRARWATTIAPSSEPVQFPPVFTAEAISRANAYLDSLYERAAQDLPASAFLTFSEDELLAAPEHKWGLSPFHYTTPYYMRLLEHLRAA